MWGQLAGLWRVGAGRELLVLVTAKTQKQKPETRKPVVQPANQTEIITEIADWPALWQPKNREVPQCPFPDKAMWPLYASEPT